MSLINILSHCQGLQGVVFFFFLVNFMFESILGWILEGFFLSKVNVIADGISKQGSNIFFLFLELQCCFEFHFLNVKSYL